MKNIIFILMLSLIVSCAKKNKGTTPSNSDDLLQGVEKQQSQKDQLSNQGYNLSLKKSALEQQTFLMTTAYISGAPSPTGRSFANKLVYFKRKGSSVFMFESFAGQLDTNDVRTEKLLAKFPIIEDKKETLVFDFDNGMKYLFQRSSYYSSASAQDSPETAIEIKESFLNQVEQRKDTLFVEQYARLYSAPSPKAAGDNFSLHIKYSFKPYVQNPNFKPTVSIGFDEVGYFENHPVHEAGSGNKTTYIAKFDHKKKITFYLEDNIPADHLQAVKDGVLYWNKAFGKEVIEVKDLPKGLDVHEPGINLVKWLNWDTAGFAYANTSVDPLTGEALQATVYMTSSFGNGGLRRAQYYLKRLQHETPKNQSAISIRGFDEHKECHRTHEDEQKRISSLLKTVQSIDSLSLSEEQKEEIYLRFANDYIRETVAHEIGHNLGLRHNFAASTQTTITAEEYDKVEDHYLLTGEVLDNKIVSTSVMDYTPSFFAAMSGAEIRLSNKAQLYDQKAIDFGYLGKEISTLPKTPFCTDHEANGVVFADCLRFDRFANPFEETKYEYARSLETMAYRLFTKLLVKTEEGIIVKEYTNFNGKNEAHNIIKYAIKPLLDRLSTKANFVQLAREFRDNSTLGQLRYAKEVKRFQLDSAKKFGGINFIISTMTPEAGILDLTKTVKEQVLKLALNNYGQLSQDILSELELAIDKYMTIIEREYLLQLIPSFNTESFNIIETKMMENLTNAVSGLILDYNNEVSNRTFDYFAHGKSLRYSAASLIQSKRASKNPYQEFLKAKGRDEIRDKLSSEITTLESGDFGATEQGYNFLSRENQILQTLR